MNELSMDYWPEELVPKLLSFLPTNDRLSACLVCKQWLKFMNQDIFLKDMCARIPTSQISSALPLTRKFKTFRFDDAEIGEEHIKFLEEYGDNIQCLMFVRCRMGAEFQEKCYKLGLCKNLTSLKFYQDYLHIFPELPHLKELVMRYMSSDLSDYEVSQWNQTMPHLEKFAFDQNMVSHERVIRRFYIRENDWVEQPSRDILCYPVMKDFIKKRVGTLVSLDITASDAEAISFSFLNVEGLKLKQLFIHDEFRAVRRREVKIVVFETLTEIHLHWDKIDDSFVSHVCESLPLLEKATFRGSKSLDRSIKDLFALQHLQHLDLGCCFGLRNESVLSAMETFKAHNLRSLDLSATFLGDRILRGLLGLVLKLQVLNLSYCKKMSNETLQFISENLSYLRRLSICGCQYITDDGVWNAESPQKCLSNLKGLEELNLNMCFRITSSVVERSVKFAGLRIFHYQECSKDLESILKSQNPSLKSIYSNILGLMPDEPL